MRDLIKGAYAAREGSFEQAHSLRRRVFRAGASDRDGFDAECTHVVVEDGGGEVVCCFRLFAHGADGGGPSYAAQFHDLPVFFEPAVEMGRFCIDPARHDPDILRTAWGFLAAYVMARQATLIFGCSSFPGVSAAPYLDTFALLQARYLGPLGLRPQARDEVMPFPAGRDFDRGRALRAMPPLLRSYLGMGGWVGDHAVIDRDLDTLHVFTALEVAAIPPARLRTLRALAS